MPRPRVHIAVGQQFGHWDVIAPVIETGQHRRARCRCKCGVERQVTVESLMNGASRSCGCRGARTEPNPPQAAAHAEQLNGLTSEIPRVRLALAELRSAGVGWENAWPRVLDAIVPVIAGNDLRARERQWLRQTLFGHEQVWRSAFEDGQARIGRLTGEDAQRLARAA